MSIKNKNKNAKMKKAKDKDIKNIENIYQQKFNFFYFLAIFFLGVGFGCIHLYHVSTMFENDTHFSHLSNLEREMSFRSEMGLYYSYYKTIVEADSFESGYYKITHDNLTEYPNTIDTLHRFNLYPEVAIGFLYKEFIEFASLYGYPTRECWSVERGTGLPPIMSCEGLGDPAYFYLECVWILASLTVFMLFVYGVYLSNSVAGGFVTVACFFFNHSEATRVQWSPLLRENFAFPFILLQMLTVTFCIRKAGVLRNGIQMVIIYLTTWMCLILWQFSQFFLTTQLIAIYIICQFKLISRQTLMVITVAHLWAICISVLTMHGNKLFVSSLHFAFCISIAINSVFWSDVSQPPPTSSIYFTLVKFIQDSAMIGCLTAFIKTEGNSFFRNKDDTHILNILKSKFTNYKDFHTLIYTCAPEFDFLPLSTVVKLILTLLLPTAIAVVHVVVYSWFQPDFKPDHDEYDDKHKMRLKNYAVEDYFEKNAVKITEMKAHEGNIQKELENLEKCSYNYDEFSKNKENCKVDTDLAKSEFFRDVEQLKSEISKKDKKVNLNNDKQSINKKSKENITKNNDNEAKRSNNKNAQSKQSKDKRGVWEGVKSYSIKINAEPEVLYNFLQLAAFIIMAALIMRLKLFMTPHLCIIASLITAKRYFRIIKLQPIIHTVVIITILLGMSVRGIHNLRNQRAILGEYSNAPLEQLLTWVNQSTPINAVFAGPMPVTSAILLSTRRPIVNHPHYENAQLRERTKMVYSIFSRKSVVEVYNALSRLQVQYVAIQHSWCFGQEGGGCSHVDLWDTEEPELKNQPKLCAQLYSKTDPKYFQRVFDNSNYFVLKLHTHSVNVELKPRQIIEYSM